METGEASSFAVACVGQRLATDDRSANPEPFRWICVTIILFFLSLVKARDVDAELELGLLL